MVNKFNYLRGGADKYFLDLADLLKDQGIEVARFCMKHPNNQPSQSEQYFVSGLDLTSFKFSNLLRYVPRLLYSIETRYKFRKLLKDFQPDIIHLHNIYHQLSPSFLPLAKKHNIPVVMHVHDYKIVCGNYKMFHHGHICQQCQGGCHYHCAANRCFKNSFFKSLLITVEMYLHHKILKIYEKNIDLYICPSQFVKYKLIEWGLPEDKLRVINHYIDARQYEPNYQPGDYLLFFGRLDQEKGVDKLVQAMVLVKDKKLKIVGFGPEYKKIKELIAELKLTDKIEMVGPKYGEELKEIIKNSYAVIVPSQWYEVFGLVSLEAAALGKLVIAANIGGIPETVKDGETAWLFEPQSAEDLAGKINQAIGQLERAEQMGRAGRQFIEQNFHPSQHSQAILEVYHKLME